MQDVNLMYVSAHETKVKVPCPDSRSLVSIKALTLDLYKKGNNILKF